MKNIKKFLCLALLIFVAPMFFISCNEGEIKELKDKISSLEVENSTLKTEKSQEKEAKKRKENEIQDLKLEITSLTSSKTQLETEKATLLNEKSTLEKQKSDLEERVASLNQSIASQSKKIDEQTQKILKLNNDKTDLQNQIAEKEKSIQSLNTTINGLNADNKELEKERDNLQAQVNKLTKEKEDLESEVNTKESEIQTLRSENEGLQEELSAKNAELEGKNASIREKDEEIARLNALVTEKKTSIENLNSQITQLNAKIQELTDENANLKDENLSLKDENKELKDEIERIRTADLRFGETYNAEKPLELNNQEGNTYMFFNCTFENGIEVLDKDVDLRFYNCIFNLGTSANFVKATSVSNIEIDGCVFEGTFQADSEDNIVIDLNLYSTVVRNIVISNNEFKVSNGAGASTIATAIAIKTRLGETDTVNTETETWALNQTAGSISGTVKIEKNYFYSGCNVITIGAKSVSSEGTANISTGAFNVSIVGATVTKEGYADSVSVYELYLDNSTDEKIAETVGLNETKNFGNKTERTSA